MLKFNLLYSCGFIEVDPEKIVGIIKVSEKQCRLIIGEDLENSNVVDIVAEHLTVIREIGTASFGSQEE